MTDLNLENHKEQQEISDAEAAELQKDFETSPEVREQLAVLIKQVLELCKEHQLPCVARIIWKKETITEDRYCIGSLGCTRFPGGRTLPSLALADAILENNIRSPEELFTFLLKD